MAKNIVFYAANDGTKNWMCPNPSIKEQPEYFRKIKNEPRHKSKFTNNGEAIRNVKSCMPYKDALSSGYIQKTWCDIFIEKNENEVRYYTSNNTNPIIGHRSGKEDYILENFYGYMPIEFYWVSQWEPSTPKGYSILITNPMNRFDLPFTTSSGIIDSDVFTLGGYQFGSAGQIPFYIRSDFHGLIPAGTPMYQYIPIRRDDWVSEFRSYDDSRRPDTEKFIRRYFTGGYLKHFWKKKNYR